MGAVVPMALDHNHEIGFRNTTGEREHRCGLREEWAGRRHIFFDRHAVKRRRGRVRGGPSRGGESILRTGGLKILEHSERPRPVPHVYTGAAKVDLFGDALFTIQMS